MSWRPDWTNESLYTTSLTPEQWRWEFLRRNDEYQKDWDKHFPDSYQKNIETYKNQPLPDGVKSWEHYFSDIAKMPNCREKYNIEYLLNPACTRPPSPFFIGMNPFFINCAEEIKLEPEIINNQTGKNAEDIFLYSFDISKPIKSQIDRATCDLKRIQAERYSKPKETRQTASWALYLRVLDAIESNERKNKICRVLYPEITTLQGHERYAGDAKLKNDIRAATSLSKKLTLPDK